MKKLRMILPAVALIGLISGCTKEDLEGSESLEQILENQECSINFEEEMAEFEKNKDEGLIDENALPPKECKELPSEPESSQLTVSIDMRSFSETQTLKMNEAIEKIKIVINSTEFRERVLAHTYQGEVTYVQNDGLTNEEIYEKIMLGAESLNLEEDQEMDIDVTMYYKNNSVIGYTYPSTPRTWVNSKFFNGYSHAQVAKNVVHECCLLYTSPSPRDKRQSRMPSSA